MPAAGFSDDDIRFGSGVPAPLKLSGLSFVEMTGIPQRAWVRALDAIEAAPPSQSPGADMLPPCAAALRFQEIIAAIEAQRALPSGETSEVLEDEQITGEIVHLDDGFGRDKMANEPTWTRPPGAVQALAEAESLLSALATRTPETDTPDATLSVMMEAFEMSKPHEDTDIA